MPIRLSRPRADNQPALRTLRFIAKLSRSYHPELVRGYVDVRTVAQTNWVLGRKRIHDRPSFFVRNQLDRVNCPGRFEICANADDTRGPDRICKSCYSWINCTIRGLTNVELSPGAFDVCTNLVGKGFQHLAARAVGCAGDAEIVQLPHRSGEDQRHGFGLICGKAGQPGTVVESEFDAALIALMNYDRETSFGQSIDVAEDGAACDLELGGQLGAGQASPVLQKQQHPEQA